MALALINAKTPVECERRLNILGHRTLRLPPISSLEEPLASHPDMLLFTFRDTLFTSCLYSEEASHILSDIWEYTNIRSIVCTDEAQKTPYPCDAIFNILKADDAVYLKTDSSSLTVKNSLFSMGIKLIHTNHGYPACSTLLLSEYAITADCGMASVLSESGIKVTLIESGGISLPPYEYGFIGGAAGVFCDTVYFFGDPKTHPSWDKIERTLSIAGYGYVPLCDGELTDLGGIVFID